MKYVPTFAQALAIYAVLGDVYTIGSSGLLTAVEAVHTAVMSLNEQAIITSIQSLWTMAVADIQDPKLLADIQNLKTAFGIS